MELVVLKEVDTPLLSRKRITFELVGEKETPSRKVLIKEVASKVKAKPELVVIKHIYTQFGSRKAKIIANVYSNKKEMENVEEKYLLKKNSLEEPKPEGETQ